MNLADLREEIASELQYNPDTTDYKNNINRVINGVYKDIVASHRWVFAEIIYEQQVRATIDSTELTAATVSVAANTAEFTFTNPFSTLTTTNEQLLGATLKVNPGLATERTFIINYVQSTTVVYSTEFSDLAFVNAPYEVIYYKYKLPEDVSDILGLVDRTKDNGNIPMVPLALEKSLDLDTAETPATTRCFLMEENKMDRAPRVALTAVQAAGNIPAGTARYFYTINNEGRETPPSPILTQTFTVNTQITLTLPDTRRHFTLGGALVYRTQRVKYVYRELDTEPGIFVRIATVNDNVTTLVDNYTYQLSEDDIIYNENGPSQYIRMWPRPKEDQFFELRYLRRVNRLQSDQDTPILPLEYHRLIVHRAVEQIAAQSEGNTLAALHRRLGDEMFRRMRKRYLMRTADWNQRLGYGQIITRNVPPTVRFTP